MFKIEIQTDDGVWQDVRGDDGRILTFAQETDAQAELTKRYPVLVQMAQYAGPERTRVLKIWDEQ